MKNTFLFAFLILICNTIFAQDSTKLNKRIYLGHGIYGQHVSNDYSQLNNDSLQKRIKTNEPVQKTTDVCTCTIDQTLINNGDNITRYFSVTDFTSPYLTYVTNGNFQVMKTGVGDQILIQILPDSVGTPSCTIHDVHSYNAVNLIADYLTAGRTVNLPDDNGRLIVGHGGNSIVNLPTSTTSYTVPLSLGFIPSRIIITLSPGNTIMTSYMVDAVSISNFTIKFDSPQIGTSAIYWEAFK